MALQTADYLIVGLAGLAALAGLFIGFSGTLAFCLGAVSAAFVGHYAWLFAPHVIDPLWARILATSALAILSFGLVRILVRKLARGILAQPADAILGFMIAGAFGLAIALTMAYLCVWAEFCAVNSTLLRLTCSWSGAL